MNRIVSIIGIFSLISLSCGTTTTITEEEELNDFRLIWLEMGTVNSLFPTSGNYNGLGKAEGAFKDGKTALKIEKRVMNIQPEVSFLTNEAAFSWAVQNAGGDINQPNLGLNWLIAIVSGVYSISTSEVRAGEYGSTYNREITGDGTYIPARSYIWCQRIRDFSPNDQYNIVVNTTGVGVHELGHARDIPQSDHTNHSGQYASTCIMLNTQAVDYENINFCDGHKMRLQNTDW